MGALFRLVQWASALPNVTRYCTNCRNKYYFFCFS